MKSKISYILFFAISFALAGNMKAQVTIGMNKAPNLAALLELAQYDDNTSSMGLLLPRLGLQGVSNAAPLSKHVPAMMAYNNNNAVSGLNKDVYINNGTLWHPLGYLPAATNAGQYLSLDNSLNLTWIDITVPSPVEGVFTLLNSQSDNRQEMHTYQGDELPWRKYGDTIKIIPRHKENRLVITVQALMNKEYDSGNRSGWINYTWGIFLNEVNSGRLLDSRNGTLVFQSFNQTVRTYSLETLHFVVENLPAGEQNILIAMRRTDSSPGYNGILYIGYDGVGDDDEQNPNLFNTSASVSVQYYEEKSSDFI